MAQKSYHRNVFIEGKSYSDHLKSINYMNNALRTTKIITSLASSKILSIKYYDKLNTKSDDIISKFNDIIIANIVVQYIDCTFSIIQIILWNFKILSFPIYRLYI